MICLCQFVRGTKLTNETSGTGRSNYFLQCAIQKGSDLLQVAITDRVAADVVTVASDRFGSYVVEACFLVARTPVPMQRLLAAFQGLREGALAELVRGNYSNYVVSKLLDAGKNVI
jgi:pumilio RNA-binding family